MRKIPTGCCALCQLDRVSNETPIQEIKNFLKISKLQMENNTDVGVSDGTGQTAVFTIVAPGEDILEKNLIELGFKHKHTFPRRIGYLPISDLKMYIKNL